MAAGDRNAATLKADRAHRDPLATLAPSVIGFGLVPGTPEEARAHVQLRIRAYVGLFAVLWTVMFFAQPLVRAAAAPELLRNASAPLVTWTHVGVAASLVLAWLLLKYKKVSLRGLDVMDAAVTKLQVFGLAAMLYIGGEPKFRTELVVILALTNLLAGRAALVPCTAARTAVFGFGSLVPQAIATYLVYTTRPVPEGFPTPIGLTAFMVVWGSIAALLSTAITRIIYGLERKVKEAKQLGQYTLESQLGSGGMGMVYLARHALLRRPTAVKLLPADKAGKDAVKRFEREVQLTSQLTHPNVVAIYDYGRTPDGVFYYAMEYLEGVDLERLVKDQGCLPAARVRHIVRQTADALAEAHSIKLIHRDIKPANIVVLSRGRQHDYVKVLDFGLVKELRPDNNAPSLSNVATLIGTPLYISPESITDPKKVDHRSDIYALGAVAYYLLTGTTVVKGRGLVEVCAWHMYEKPEPPSKRLGKPVPASLETLILKCLEKDPAKRPQSAAEIVEALDLATDIPAWTAADAEIAWQTAQNGEAGRDKAAGQEHDATSAVRERDTPIPASRAMPVDLENR
ncbi:MAG: serine/threonine protein kinase [Polyangiaceae bacterium]|nr:serine/threonine protein kinase [Polyangiaceae bacterium]